VFRGTSPNELSKVVRGSSVGELDLGLDGFHSSFCWSTVAITSSDTIATLTAK